MLCSYTRPTRNPEAPPKKARLKKNDLVVLQRSIDAVELPEDVVALLASLRQWCAAEGIQVSDRRWRKIVKLLRVSALTNGRRSVSQWDCWLLQHCTWREPEDRKKIFDWYSARVGASSNMDTSRTTKIVVSWEARLKADQDSRSQMTDEEGRLMYRAADGSPTPEQEGNVRAMKDGEPLFLAPPQSYDGRRWIRDRTNSGNGYTEGKLDRLHIGGSEYDLERFEHWDQRADYLTDRANWLYTQGTFPPIIEPTRHKDVYVDACLAELDSIKKSIQQYLERLVEHVASLHEDISSNLWVLPDFGKIAGAQLERTGSEITHLKSRLERVAAGYTMLPRESTPREKSTGSEESPAGRRRSTLFHR